MNKILFFSVYFFTNHFIGDDDVSRKTDDAFLSGALTSATNKQLEGRWAIFQIEFESKMMCQSLFPNVEGIFRLPSRRRIQRIYFR
jgi:hypothetical protein